MGYRQTLENYSALERNGVLTHRTMWMCLGNQMLSEIRQSQETTCCLMPFIGNVQNRQIHRDINWVSASPGAGGAERRWGSDCMLSQDVLLE